MGKFWVFMLATAPYQAFFVWAAWWLTCYWLGERRTARAAADAARESARRPEQDADPPRLLSAFNPRTGMPTQLTTPSRSILAPYVTAWSTERSLSTKVITVPGVGIAYADETITDRDRNGVLWCRVGISPGHGRPDFGRVHPQRQHRTMLRLLCQVCGGPADQTEQGVLWLLRDFRDDWPDWPNRMGVNEPPICLPCVQTSLDRCPALHKGAVTIRARRYPVAAARGALYAGPELTYTETATVALDDPKIRWLRAISLVRELNDCTIIPLDKIGN